MNLSVLAATRLTLEKRTEPFLQERMNMQQVSFHYAHL